MASYTKTFAKTTGDTVETTDLSTECDNLEAAFNNTTGHKHDGTSAEGPVVALIGDAGVIAPLNKVVVNTPNDRISFYIDVASVATEQIRLEDGVISPVTDSDVAIGTTTERFSTIYVDDIVTTNTIPSTSISEASVTQHEAALSITESQISDLGTSALLTSDIGVSVQGYDADTAKYDDVTANFTGSLQSSGVEVATLGANTFVGNQYVDVSGAPGWSEVDVDVSQYGGFRLRYDGNPTGYYLTGQTYNRILKLQSNYIDTAVRIDLNEAGWVDVAEGILRYGGVEVATLGANTFTGTQTISNAAPALVFNETDAGTDEKNWRLVADGSQGFRLDLMDDASSAYQSALRISRTGYAVDIVNFMNGTLQYGGVEVATLNTNWTEADIIDLGNYIEASGVTYENLNTNGDIGTGAAQVAQGNHLHTGVYEPADAAIAKTDEATNFTAGLQSGGVDVAVVNKKYAVVRQSTSISVSDSTDTILTFSGTELYDTDSFHSAGSPSRLTIPSGVSLIKLWAQVTWTTSGTGSRRIEFKKNGATYIGGRDWIPAPSDLPACQTLQSHVLEVTAGDYFEVEAYQTSGGSLNVAPNLFAIEVLK